MTTTLPMQLSSTAIDSSNEDNVPHHGDQGPYLQIAGIIVGILVILAIIAFALWFLRRERRRDGNRASLIPKWRASFLNRDSAVPPISRTSRLISHRTCC